MFIDYGWDWALRRNGYKAEIPLMEVMVSRKPKGSTGFNLKCSWPSSLCISCLLYRGAFAAPAQQKRASAPAVTLSKPEATFIGSSSNNIDSFNGIPFVQPPTGSLRLKPPKAISSSLGTIKATGTAKSCPQFYFSTDTSGFPVSVLGELANIPIFQKVTNAGKDCLTVSVRRPPGTTADAKLPVLVWMFGSGFELGSTQMYDGSTLVSASVDLDMPILFVAMN